MILPRLLLFAVIAATPLQGAEVSVAATAINALGLDLHREHAASGNTCLSPYSIQVGLAMAYAGAGGATRAEMARVLHYPADDEALNASLGALAGHLAAIQAESAELAQLTARRGGAMEPVVLTVANRLFAQQGFEFRPAFTSLLREQYHAPLELVDFEGDGAGATDRINAWVAAQTRDRIRDIVPRGALGPDSRLTLANAVYLKAAWAHPFYSANTAPRPFHVGGAAPVDVPTMNEQRRFGYRRFDGFSAVTLGYVGGSLQFLVLVPDAPDGLASLEAELTPGLLRDCARLPERLVDLYLPKLKLALPAIGLAAMLQHLGMTSAFDLPKGSADFDRMAPRRDDEYMGISDIFHKTFLSLDEDGTEAAAATVLTMVTLGAARERPEQPMVVRVDRPFFYAIQDVSSGACLFLGRVVDPR